MAMTMLDPQEIGRRIRQVRVVSGLTQDEVAERAWGSADGMLVSRLEQGFYKTIDLGRLVAVANAVAHEGLLKDHPAEVVLDYFMGRVSGVSLYMSYFGKDSQGAA